VVAEGAKAFTDKVVDLLRSAPLRAETARRQLAWIERSLTPKAALSSFTALI
jgi:hypothetical protein